MKRILGFVVVLLLGAWLAVGQELHQRGGSGGGTWGSITGTLSDQTDLQTALDGKYAVGGADVAIADGGTGQSTQTAAFNALDPLTTEGDLLAHDGTNSIRFPLGVIGQFLRVNTNVAGSLEWATGPNVADQDADASSSSNTVTSMLLNMAATPAPDTWFAVDCAIVYQTAATTTGITISLFANNAGLTAAPQFFTAKFTIGGFGAAGTDSDWVAHVATQGTLVTTTDVQAANTPYVLTIHALILTHVSAVDAFVTPQFRSEVNLSAVTIKEGSYCKGYVLHVDS